MVEPMFAHLSQLQLHDTRLHLHEGEELSNHFLKGGWVSVYTSGRVTNKQSAFSLRYARAAHAVRSLKLVKRSEDATAEIAGKT